VAFATIQITQGAVIGGSGESVLGFDRTTGITLTDDAGAGALSYQWEIISWPGPDAAAPTIGTPTAQVATITPPGGGITDGIYIVKLTRNDVADGVTTDVRFFGVEDLDGLSLPVAGMNRTMSNVGGSAAAQEAGWFGRADGSTNVLLDAFLRLRRKREGRYQGLSVTSTHSSGTPIVTELVYGVDAPDRNLTMTGAGTLTHELSDTGAEDGAVFRHRVTFNAGAGNLILKDGVAGPTILTLTAPPISSSVYEVVSVRMNGAWVLFDVSLVDSQGGALLKRQAFDALNGVGSNATATFARIGNVRIDPSQYPSNAQIRFQAIIETTTNTVECQLYNVTDGGLVASSTLSSTSTTADFQEAVITLPSSAKLYEVQLRITPVGGGGDQAVCTNARVLLEWA